MNNVLVYFQYLGIALLLVEIAFTLYQPPSISQSMILILITAALINTIGYTMELKATSKELALYAVKFIYIGKPFIIVSMFLFVLNYCRISFPKILDVVLYILHALISFSVFTCDSHNWFYTNIEFTTEGLYPHLILDHGFLYYFFIFLCIFYSVCMVICCIRRYRHSREHAERTNIIYLTLIVLIPLTSYIVYFTGITNGYDITAASYILCGGLLLICYIKYNLLSALRIAKDDVLDNLRDGILFLNTNSEPVYSNKIVDKLYPELNANHPEGTLEHIKSMVSHKKNLFIEDQVYSIHENEVYDQKKKVGTLIKIENITDNYNYTKRLQHDVKEKTKEINQIQHTFITSFANLVEARDGLTGTHIKNTSRYVYLICRELQNNDSYKDIMTNDFIDIVVEAAPLHDIGKITIPDAILLKPGKLTPEEFEIIKTHASVGGQIIREIMDETGDNLKLRTACNMAEYHHERWDGKGYPVGLKGEEIPLCARIMALADVYDALISKRCYKEPIPQVAALDIIKQGKGTQFDPVLTEIFLKINL